MNSSRSLSKLFLSLLVVVLLLSSCDLTGNKNNDPDATQELVQTIHPATLTAISVAVDKNSTPIPDPLGIAWSELDGVEIEFWYIWDVDEPGAGLNAIVDRFNRNNTWGISVTPVDQGLTHDPLDSIGTAFQEGLVPHVMVIDTTAATRWFQDDLIIDLDPYLSDPSAGLDHFEQGEYFPGIFDHYLLYDGVRPGIPFTQTIQVIYYNQTWAADLGFTYVPRSLSDLHKQICTAAKDQPESTGMIIYPEAANIASWVYAYGGEFLNDDGAYQFTTSEVLDVSLAWREMIRKQCGSIVTDYPNPMAVDIEFDWLNNRQALMIMNSSQYFGQPHFPLNASGRGDDWTMLPFIGPDGKKVVASQIQSGVIFKTTPEQQLASWLFLKYLTSPEIQAEWVQYSSKYPTRKDSLEYLEEYRIKNPDWAKGLDLLKFARAQPVDPSWDIVLQAAGDAFAEILSSDLPNPEDVLQVLDEVADELQNFTRE
jgi:ABC-type glycerol-3-phosphate transport system substrate-binding protein